MLVWETMPFSVMSQPYLLDNETAMHGEQQTSNLDNSLILSHELTKGLAISLHIVVHALS